MFWSIQGAALSRSNPERYHEDKRANHVTRIQAIEASTAGPFAIKDFHSPRQPLDRLGVFPGSHVGIGLLRQARFALVTANSDTPSAHTRPNEVKQ